MTSLEILNNRLNEYNVFINKINGIRDELTKAYNSLENATNIGSYYSIDNISADENSILMQRKNILSINNHLGTIISSVNNTVTSTKNHINYEKSKIDYEEENVDASSDITKSTPRKEMLKFDRLNK